MTKDKKINWTKIEEIYKALRRRLKSAYILIHCHPYEWWSIEISFDNIEPEELEEIGIIARYEHLKIRKTEYGIRLLKVINDEP